MARRLLTCFCLVLLLQALVSAADDTKPDAAKPAAKEPMDPYTYIGELSGKLTRWDENNHSIGLDVTIKQVVPDQDAINKLEEMQKQLLQAYQIPNPAERQRKIFDLQGKIVQQQSKLTKVKEDIKKYDLLAAEGMIVRLPQPPIRFTNKGDPWPYTAQDLQELRAKEPNMPGYPGAVEHIKVNAEVTVYVYRKNEPPASEKPPAEEKPKDGKPENKLYVRLFVIQTLPRE